MVRFPAPCTKTSLKFQWKNLQNSVVLFYFAFHYRTRRAGNKSCLQLNLSKVYLHFRELFQPFIRSFPFLFVQTYKGLAQNFRFLEHLIRKIRKKLWLVKISSRNCRYLQCQFPTTLFSNLKWSNSQKDHCICNLMNILFGDARIKILSKIIRFQSAFTSISAQFHDHSTTIHARRNCEFFTTCLRRNNDKGVFLKSLQLLDSIPRQLA